MGVLAAVTSIGGNILGMVSDHFKAQREEKAEDAQLRREIKRASATAEIEEAQANGNFWRTWAMEARDKVAWADDALTAWVLMFLTAPFVGLEEWVLAGLEVINTYPDWLKGLIGLVWASAFGIRHIPGLFGGKKR